MSIIILLTLISILGYPFTYGSIFFAPVVGNLSLTIFFFYCSMISKHMKNSKILIEISLCNFVISKNKNHTTVMKFHSRHYLD